MAQSTSISYREFWRRWLPRLLGITPLLVFGKGLIGIGPDGQGMGMVAVLGVLILLLLLIYTEVSLLSDPREEPANPALALVHNWVSDLANPGQREQSWWRNGLARLLRSVTASPFSCMINDISMECEGSDAIQLPIAERLNISVLPDHRNQQKAYVFNELPVHHPRITKINGVDIAYRELPAQFQVSGGVVEVKTATPASASNADPALDAVQVWFKPGEAGPGRFEFPYTITYTLGNETKEQSETATVAIRLRGPASAPSAHAKADKQSQPGSLLAQISAVMHELQTSVETKSSNLIEGSRWTIAYLLQLRIQVAVALICFLVFQTQQVQDVLLALVLDQERGRFAWAALFGGILSLLLWHSSRQLTRLFPQIHRLRLRKGSSVTLEPQSKGIFSATFELVLFALAWLSISLFTVPIARDAFEQDGSSAWMLHLLKPYLLFLLGALFIFLWRRFDRPQSTWNRAFSVRFWQCFVIGLLIPILCMGLEANQIPAALGSISILFWALSIVLIVTTTIYRFSVLSGIPLLATLLATTYLLNINRVFDNHAIRIRQPAAGIARDPGRGSAAGAVDAERTLPKLEDTFDTWIQEHAPAIRDYWDRQQEPKNGQQKHPYPIYVISAQGGGIYAAYHTAKALATLTDLVPGFDEHVFAISGVSGGSVGSTIYRMALSNHRQDNPRQDRRTADLAAASPSMSDRIDHYFDRRDALSTILASLLFGDITERFFPIGVAQWDRALGLELGFENRRGKPELWSKTGRAIQPIDLSGSFYEEQRPHGITTGALSLNSSLPYLVLNTTEVGNGRRYLLAPFMMDSDASDADIHQPWQHHPDRPFDRDLNFSTAAALSARFPIVSPYGFFSNPSGDSGPRRRFVDGGLYDNSGAITATEIVKNLKRIIHQRNIQAKNKAADEPKKFTGTNSNTPQPSDTDQAKTLQDTNKGFNPYIHVEIVPIAIVDQKAVSLNSNYATARFRLVGWSAIEAVLSSREARLQKAADLLGLEDDHKGFRCPEGRKESCGPLRILLSKQFQLGDGRHDYSIPLGWKISCQARAFISDQLRPRQAEGTDPQDRSIPCEKALNIARKASEAPSTNFTELVHSLRQDVLRETK